MAMNRLDVQLACITKELLESLQSLDDFVAGNFGIAVAMEFFGF